MTDLVKHLQDQQDLIRKLESQLSDMAEHRNEWREAYKAYIKEMERLFGFRLDDKTPQDVLEWEVENHVVR